MVSKFTIIGDPHLTPANSEKVLALCKKVEELGNPSIWLGDMLDTKEIVRARCLNQWIRYFSRSKLKHYVIVGNHDYFNLECKDHSLRALKELHNVTVIDKLTHIPETRYWAVPFLNSPAEVKKVLKNIPHNNTILFGHFEIGGFDWGNGYVCENKLTKEHFSKFDKVVTGHFHKKQVIDNILYLGSPFSLSFGESNQTKYLGILHPQSKEIELIETDFSKHITLEVSVSEWEEKKKEINEKDYFRVILKGTEKELATINKSEFPHVRFVEKEIELERDDGVIKESDSNEVKFASWAEKVKNIDKKVIKLGLEILGE